MSDNQAKLDAACAFLLQSPPGEVNDVLSDLRAILLPSGLSPSEIKAGLASALQQYHETQFTPVSLGETKGLVTRVNKGEREGEYEEPREGKVFKFDHLSGTASSSAPSTEYTSPFTPETDSTRTALDKLLSTHVSNHYASGVSAVYILPDAAYPPEEAAPALSIEEASLSATKEDEALAKDVQGSEQAVAETAAETAQVVQEVLEHEGVESTQAQAEAEGGEAVPTTESAGQAQDDAPKDEEEGVPTAAAEDDKMDIGSPAPAVPDTAAASESPEDAPGAAAAEPTSAPAPAPPKPRPSNQFGLYFVGHKYSPNNYWTGRWRSTYSLDQATGNLEGTAQVNIHYYEQGNVQLSTTFKSTSTLGATPSPEAVIASIKSSESSLQRQLGETYAELADASFRGLRRALPKTRSKLDWDRAVGYKLGRELGGGGAQAV
ncbi:hypothetical protein JCM10908_007123 [Rhodotorula pacifica]|uniref:Cap1p n=1 Tax=Rhodotorula pacifica TaxID=1495444 RepID=UPI00317FD41A